MAYNGYPLNYGIYNPYNAPVNAPVTPPMANPQNVGNSAIIWVQGEAGAKAYPVAAGNSVQLMDSERQVFYIKSTDNSI